MKSPWKGKRMLRACLVLGLGFILSACGSDEPEGEATGATECSVDAATVAVASKPAEPTTRYIVKFSNRTSRLSAGNRLLRTQKLASAITGGARVEELGHDVSLLKLNAPIAKEQLERQLPKAEIEYIEPDEKVYASYLPDDPKLSSQWAHEMVNSSEAWDVSRGSSSVVVAVLDTGIDYTHQDLAANMWRNPKETAGNGVDDDGNGYVDDVYGWNFVDDSNAPLADDASSFHGTHVAGTVGAVGNNGVGIAGHSPKVKLMALKFLSKDGGGYTSDAVKGVNYAVKMKAKIINNSWGGGSKSQALSDAIDRARAAGVLFVVAAGNSAQNNDKVDSYPTNYPQDNLVRVAASDSNDKLARFSNYGPRKVDLAAPGVKIYSTKNGNAYQNLSGTSMATPLVSGVLATMIAARPDLSYRQIKGALLANVDAKSAYRGKVLWNGRVNAARALNAVDRVSLDWEPPSPPPYVACEK